jgi:aryl-alcohol dehydrogenase
MTNVTSPTKSITAAVVRESGGPFLIETVQLGELRDDEVLVQITATGMCHTDMVIRDQIYPVPLPIVLGHEGSGIVAAVGQRVVKVSPGDHVVLTFLPCGQCRTCWEGTPSGCEAFNEFNFAGCRPDGSHALHDSDGHSLHDRFFGQSSFATFAVANARNVVKVRKDVPLEILGPLGCGFQTGAGAVLNVFKIGPGNSFAAFGAGAVGLSAVMAAASAGATTIIAVDIVAQRLEQALAVGATHVINSRERDPVEAIRQIAASGVDYTLDSTGLPAVVRAAVEALRPRGTCGIVGASKPGTDFAIDATDVMQKCKIIRGIIEGDSIPDLFIPRLIELYTLGRFPFDKLVRLYPLDRINDAAQDSERGLTVKPVIQMML